MDFFRSVGNWFRGAFGGNDDEKRRREEEARRRAEQARAANLRNQKPRAQTPEYQRRDAQPQINHALEQRKQTTTDPLNIIQPQEVKPKEAPRVKPLPDREFRAFTLEDKKRDFLPDQKVVKAEGTITTNKDKFVAQFDKLPEDIRNAYYRQIEEKAKTGDKASINAFAVLKAANRAPRKSVLDRAADIASIPGRNILRVGTGVAQTVPGLYDLASPGEGTNRVSQWLDRVAQAQDQAAEEAGVGTAYRVGNVAAEIGSYIIPSVAAARIARAFPKGAKLTQEVAERAARLVDDPAEASRVRKFLADRIRNNMTLEEALEEAAISARYMGQNTGRGGDTSWQSVATDVATGIGGGLLFPGGRNLRRAIDDGAADEIIGATATATARAADNARPSRAVRQNVDEVFEEVEKKGVRNATEEELEIVANDLNRPTTERRAAIDEIERRAEEARRVSVTPEPETTALEHKQQIEQIIREEEDRLRDYVNRNQNLTPQQLEQVVRASRERAEKLIEDLQQSRMASIQAVDNQAEQVAETVAKQQEVVEEVADEAAARTTPPPKDVVSDTPQPASPEAEANNAYNPDTNDFSDVNYTDGADELMDSLMTRMGYDLTRQERKNLWSQFFGLLPRAQQAITHPISDLTNEALSAASRSRNSLTSGLAQAPRGIWSRFGMTNQARASLDRLDGLRNTATDVGLRIARRRNDTIKSLLDSGNYTKEQLTETFHRVFETPDFIQRVYGDGNKLDPSTLPPEIKRIVDEQIELNKIRNRLNFETGVIDEATYFQGIDGTHTPRVYGFDFTKKSNRSNFTGFDDSAGISRLDVNDVPDEIFETIVDPLTAQDIRFQQALINKSRMDAIKEIKATSGAFDSQPNKGYTQLKGKQFGELDGKWVDNQVASALKGSAIFKTKAGQKADDLLNTWRESPLGAMDRFFKQTKTVGSAGTHVGNIGSNITAFSSGAGVDPAHSLVRGLGGAKSLIADAQGKFDADVYFLRKAGIIGSDTGRALNGVPQKDVIRIESMLTEAENLSRRNPNKAAKLFSDAWGMLQDVYGGTDDAFKVGIFREMKARGLSDEAATRIVREQFQNYANVGHGVAMAADSPVMGKPFARFIPELARIMKNSARNNPIGVGAGLYGLSKASDALSAAAGETEEERRLREDALGQTRLPGGLSLNIPVGDSSVNIARSVGLNFPMDTNRDPNTALANQMSPVAIPVREDKGGHTVFAPEETVSSMTFNPIARMFANRDFMGRRITDPDNTVRWEGNGQSRYKYENPDGTPMDADNSWLNRARMAAMSYLPFSSEIDAAQAAARGEEDFYGKVRTIPEAVGRMFGVKVESNDQEARDRRASQEQYFGDTLPEIRRFLDENPDLTNAYWELKNTARDRNTEVSQNDLVSPERFKIIQSDKSGRLFNFLKEQAIKRAAKENTQVDPLYLLPQDEANQVIALKAMYTGDDVKFQQLLYKQPWFEAYKKAERAYHENRPDAESFPGAPEQNERPKQWYALSEELYSPEGVQSRFPLVKQYNEAISKFENYDSDERKEFTRNWFNRYGDAYNAQKEAYEQARLDIVNRMRAIEGAPPLTMEIWKGKFETEEDQGYGRRGGWGYGGGRDFQSNLLGRLTNFTGSVDRLNPITPKEMPNLARLFSGLRAGGGGGRRKPPIGGSSRGQV